MRPKLADNLHRIAVTSLVGLTAFGALTFGIQVYKFLTVPRSRQITGKEADKPSTAENMAALISNNLRTVFGLVRSVSNSMNFSTANKRSWNILRANHVAIATGDLAKSVKLYQDVLGIKTSESVPLPEHGVTTVFVELPNLKLELLLPLGEKSPIENFLQKSPSGGMHHICLEVDNIENAVADLKEKNVRLLSDKPKIGAHGKPVIFLHPKDCGGILVELEEV
ncbi:hypothetical protein JTE90_026899 [Oedothorax gibbosus]|uniref:Methylmalonyl-CoA epimerase, mitochondrial n=1 Tax=Oedothorax gibbosus TaxID=931172 RepID=A0AAV6UDZ6_9ARAC|nr:hypothetical protein JTE90_026899 [Oedothorax gibbosus]